jgi:type I restriction enzyme S subunit
MKPIDSIPLNDTKTFELVSGLWKGKRPPLQPCSILRSTNFRLDGLLDYSDIAQFDVEEAQYTKRKLIPQDIIIERSGGGPKQPVGRIGYFLPADNRPYATSNFTTVIRIKNKEIFEPRFVSFYLHHLYLLGATENLQRATTGIRNLDWNEYLNFEIPRYLIEDQKKINIILENLQNSYLIESKKLDIATELKRSAMQVLFTHGLSKEAQKETEIGLVPESWEMSTVGNHFSAKSGGTPSRTNQDFWTNGNIPWVKTTEVNYNTINSTDEFITEMGLQNSAAKIYPKNTILMAMYGQGQTRGRVAILGIEATCNQACAALNAIDNKIDPMYLFHYLTFRYEEIRSLAHGGQQQNLNLDIVRDIKIAYPKNIKFQNAIVEILDSINKKIDLHKRKRAVLEALFKSMLHKLMTGEIRVSDLDLSGIP